MKALKILLAAVLLVGCGNDCDALGEECETCDGDAANTCMTFAHEAMDAGDKDTCASALESFSCDDYASGD